MGGISILTKWKLAIFFVAVWAKSLIVVLMISIKKNSNFPTWIQVFAFGQMIAEVKGNARALRLAKSIAKDNGATHINVFGELKKVEENACLKPEKLREYSYE